MGYFWLLIVLLVILAAIGIYFLHKKGKLQPLLDKVWKKKPIHEDYVWLGQGEHPFKEKDEEK